MTIPSGSGSEVAKSSNVYISSSSAVHYLGSAVAAGGFSCASGTSARTVNANMIVTILNWHITEEAGDDETVTVMQRVADASTTHTILKDQALAGKQTFSWSDRIILMPSDEIRIQAGDSATLTAMFYYIVQDWT